MATLHLLRHAKSSWDPPGLADADRPLAPRGERAGRLIADHVRRRGVRPELILCSPALRARQTLELVAADLGGGPIRYEEDIYGAAAEELLERLRRVPAATDSVLMVGHNPGHRDLAVMLGADESAIGKFPTGALATFELPAWAKLGPGCGRLVEFAKPKQLG